MIERQRFANFLRHFSKNALLATGFGQDIMLNNDLIDMHSKCGRMDLARKVFDRMLDRNVVSWTARMGILRNLISWNVMIAGYVLVENGYMGLALFQKMREGREIPDHYTFASMFKACSSRGAFLLEGSQMHGFLITIERSQQKVGMDWLWYVEGWNRKGEGSVGTVMSS
ncbi:hypothetical protein SAY86_016628 [Trapa natans]|uniref:Pentatricopeptide repeat-containing protein n=1 Tax=Trapa natans TaxID=22666 RepID=A0AAN7LKG9_TRANT|nr:hypothetical protein SAY86_016628 [Trapa natans]